jgi:hypothetical protein
MLEGIAQPSSYCLFSFEIEQFFENRYTVNQEYFYGYLMIKCLLVAELQAIHLHAQQ